MPPKRKARLPSRATSTPSGETLEQAIEDTATKKTNVADQSLVPDAWTDEQETSLFKGMIKWKPVGMHKHFRMIAISQHLRNHGYTSPQDNHTRIPGIWEKLGNLYNLDALDERENSLGDGGSEDTEHTKEPFSQFTLPEDGYGTMMFSKRLALEGSSSPPSLPRLFSGDSGTATQRQSTIEHGDGWGVQFVKKGPIKLILKTDQRSSPASIRGRKSARTTRTSKVTRASKLQEVSEAFTERRSSKASLDDGTEEDQKEGDGDTMEGIERKGENTPRSTPKSAAGNARKRRSGRRR